MALRMVVMDPLQRQVLVDAVVAVILAITGEFALDEPEEPDGESATVR